MVGVVRLELGLRLFFEVAEGMYGSWDPEGWGFEVGEERKGRKCGGGVNSGPPIPQIRDQWGVAPPPKGVSILESQLQLPHRV